MGKHFSKKRKKVFEGCHVSYQQLNSLVIPRQSPFGPEDSRATKFACDMRLRTESTKAKISVCEIARRKGQTNEAKYKTVDEIYAKIATAQFKGWCTPRESLIHKVISFETPRSMGSGDSQSCSYQSKRLTFTRICVLHEHIQHNVLGSLRELTKTMTATRTSPNKRFNEQNNCCACAL